MSLSPPKLPVAFQEYRFHSCLRSIGRQWAALTAGIAPKARPPRPEHWKPSLHRWQLHVVLAGYINVHCDGRTMGSCGPGDWFRIAAGSDLISYPDASSDFVEVVFIVNGVIARSLSLCGVLPTPSRCGQGRLHADLFDTVTRLLAAVERAGRDASRIWPLAAVAQFAQDLEQVAAPELESDPLLEQACQVLADWSQPCRMGDLARRLDVSQANLRMRFEQRFACSPRSWRSSERLRQACNLLQDGNSVATTASRLGFSDAMEFSKQFRKAMGCPPSRWVR